MDLLKNKITGAVSNVTGIQLGEWHDGLCDCCADTSMCLQTICCTYCTLANIQNQRDTGVGAFDMCACCGIMAATYVTGYDYIPWMAFAFRRELIQKYHIGDESVCRSCMYGLCCFPCSFCQVQREMGKRNDHAGGCCATPPPSVTNMVQASVSGAGGFLGGVLGNLSNTIDSGHAPHPWSSGVCQCNAMECLEGLFCYCCVFGYMGNKLNSGRGLALPPLGAPNSVDCLTCFSALWYPLGHIYANRREIIQRYNVFGESHTMSCIYTLCCPVCAMCQQRREMGAFNEWPGGLCLAVSPIAPVTRLPM